MKPDKVSAPTFPDLLCVWQVTKEDRKAAMEDQFGGEASEGKARHQFSSLFKSQSAYMLVYIRESEWNEIMGQVSEDDVALHLRERVRVRCCLWLLTDEEIATMADHISQTLSLPKAFRAARVSQ